METASTSNDMPAAIEAAETISAEKPAESKETIVASRKAETEASDITAVETLVPDAESEPSAISPLWGRCPAGQRG